MQIHELQKNNSILNRYLAEIRAVNIQQDALRFRKNMERISEILAYEMSKSFHYNSESIDSTWNCNDQFTNKSNRNCVNFKSRFVYAQ